MNIQQLRPASELAKRAGVKILAYGPPGTGKTPISATAPRPVLCAIEPGLLSLKSATNLPVWAAHDEDPDKCLAKINEFFDWVFRSPEAKNFETFCVDSVTEYAQIVLKTELKRNKHGQQAYGKMAETVMNMMNAIYYSDKNWYLICKQSLIEIEGNQTKVPGFPGTQINRDIPHLFDEIFCLDLANIPGAGQQIAFRTKNAFGVKARDRSGNLAEFEPPHLGQIFQKCMS